MEAFTDVAVRELWVMKSAQVTWTTLCENFIGYHVDQDPAPILLVEPTLDLAEAFSKDRLAPMIRDTPVLRGKIADARSRDSGNTLLHKRFPGGHLTLAGANAASGLRARPIRIVLFDEVDAYPASAGTEGNPISLGKKRQTAFWNRRTAGGSTPTIKGASQIEEKFELSDQRYYFVPCPHCKEMQRLFWAQVKWEDDKPDTARYVCRSCGALWNDGERIAALAFGEWRSSKPFTGIAGFHIWEAYSPFVRLEEMVRNFLEAKKLPETLQTFVNTSLAETWEETGQTVEPEGLLARREPYGPGEIPAGVLMLTVGGDVQDDRIECELLGWGADEECWILEKHVIRGDPGDRRLWKEEVDEYLKRRYSTEDNRKLGIEAAGFDSGGHHTQAVYDYCVARRRFRIWAVKGQAGTGKLAWPKKASRVSTSRVPLFIVGVDTIKATLYGRLEKVAQPGAGYIHLPESADVEFCRQFTSETRLHAYVKGRRVTVWKPRVQGIAQEAQDCWVYGYAAFIGRGGPRIIGQRLKRMPRAPRALQADKPLATEPEVEPTPPPPPDPFRQGKKHWASEKKPSWVKRWRKW